MRAGLGRHRHRRHAGQGGQPLHQVGDEFEHALHRLLRLERVDVAEARQPRHLLVEARVVLHRAGAERIEPGIDRVVHARQAHIVTDYLRLREARQTDRPLEALAAEARLAHLHVGDVDAGHARAAELEDQALFMVEPAVAGDRGELIDVGRARRCGAALLVHGHDTTSASALAKASQSSFVLVSVAATIRRSRAAVSCGISREAGTPAMMFLAARASTTSAAGFGRRNVNSLKKLEVTSDTPSILVSLSANADALA